MQSKVKIGLLGLGTVGSGVVKTLAGYKNIEIKKIAVKNINKVRNIADLPADIITDQPEIIVNDPEINIVIEVIGGITPAFDLIKTAIQNKKHIVTANKELIAKHGSELFELAKENNIVILYEAAVAGGIPIIMPVKTSLAANKITKVAGILNGTTNYILTKMEDLGADFNSVLKEAQDLGYAEADPSGDVEGYDAAYKIAILASIAFNERIAVSKIYREGIDKITISDIKYANELGYTIKLIALAQFNGQETDVRVHPMLVSKSHPLAHINGVMNAVAIEGFPVGQVMFSGLGAGEFPTASSVAGDVLAIVDELNKTDYPLPMMRCKHKSDAIQQNIENTQNKYYISVNSANQPGVIGELGTICGKNNINLASIIQKGKLDDDSAVIVLLTELAYEKDINTAILEIKQKSTTKNIINVIRVMD
jgi:homoserine dehydrogenase